MERCETPLDVAHSQLGVDGLPVGDLELDSELILCGMDLIHARIL